jgi:hypothetical protein
MSIPETPREMPDRAKRLRFYAQQSTTMVRIKDPVPYCHGVQSNRQINLTVVGNSEQLRVRAKDGASSSESHHPETQFCHCSRSLPSVQQC